MITSSYFNAPDFPEDFFSRKHRSDSLMYNIPRKLTDEFLKKPSVFDIAIIGIPEDRNADEKGASLAPDAVRKKLYELYKPHDKLRIIDFGNLKKGKNIKDTYFAIEDISRYLFRKKIVPVFIGGSQDLIYPVFKALEEKKKPYNITAVDSEFDISESTDDLHSKSTLSKIIGTKPRHLFNYTSLAYQTYYTAPEDRILFEDMLFDYIRLGVVQNNLDKTEPFFRNCDFSYIDISAVRMSEAPAQHNAPVHGLYGEELCRMADFAGRGTQTKAFGIYEIVPELDYRSKTAELAAQAIWYFIRGYYLRTKDYPVKNSKDYKRIIVPVNSAGKDIIFYKSMLSGRWWIEIPVLNSPNENKMLVACSSEAHRQALAEKIPDIWWKYHRKING